MSPEDPIRRKALEERIRIAEQDLDDLARQIEEGELDEATAAPMEARYRAELAEARKGLAALPKPKAAGRAVAKPAAGRAAPSGRNPLVVLGLAVGAMVVVTVAIFLIARGGGDSPATTAAAPSGGMAGSVAELEAAVAAQPQNNVMRLALAGIYFDQGDFMNAMNHYSTVTDNDPTPEEAAEANAHIGWMAYAALDDPDTALAFLDAAIALDPAYGEAVLWKGIVLLYGKQDGPAAAALFEQVLGYPDLPEAIRADVETMLDEATGGGQ